MKHALIVGHPNQDSFTMTIARAYAEEARALGHEVLLRDLYRMGFEPRLGDREIPRPAGFAAADDVLVERKFIAEADVFAFVYPVWFNLPPAEVVGYVQRVFGMGFGYGPIHGGRNEPLLVGRSMISFSSSGAPTSWIKSEGGLEALRNLFDEHVANTCGMKPLDHVHFGRVTPGMAKAHVDESVDTTKRAVRSLATVSV